MTSHHLFGRDAAPVRVVGIDPGSTQHGVAWLDVSASAATLVGLHYPDTPALSKWLQAAKTLTPEGVDVVVAFETSVGVHPGVARKRGVAAALSVARASTAAVRADGVLEGVCGVLGLRVERCTAVEWRKAIVGNAQASDAEIARVVPQLVTGWPKRSSAHHRDAALVALYVARRGLLVGRVA